MHFDSLTEKRAQMAVASGTAHALYLAVNSDAIDAGFGTKQEGLRSILADNALPLSDVAVIGDSANDLPFLLVPGARIVGAPQNAQPRVLEAVRALPSGIVLDREGLAGFLTFYERCAEQGIRLIVSDRDGVLKWKNDLDHRPELQAIYGEMGSPGHPLVVVLTGSSADQNARFVRETGIDEALRLNPRAAALPPLFYAENGNVLFDPQTKRVTCRDNIATPSRMRRLLGPVKDDIVKAIEQRILPTYNFGLTDDASDQRANVYLPAKYSMITVNVPKFAADGTFFRDSAMAEAFREDVAAAFRLAFRNNALSFQEL